MPRDRIILSAKVSAVQDLIAVYQDLARRSDYAIHLGLTEAGMGSKGIVASSAAIGILLQEGIGDTIRYLADARSPAATARSRSRRRRNSSRRWAFAPSCRSSPPARAAAAPPRRCSRNWRGTSRTGFPTSMPEWKRQYPGTENLTVAVMGCIVNGPGESKHANIGISLPGTGEQPTAPVFIDGARR